MIEHMSVPTSIPELIATSCALGAADTGTLSPGERALVRKHAAAFPKTADLEWIASRIRSGHDPLGDAYCAIRTPAQRRPLGQTYTPQAIVRAMVAWADDRGAPVRVVDPGAGSGRYLLAAAQQFPEASLHGSDIDPLATLMLRAGVAVLGLADRTTVHLGDYRDLALGHVDGPTLFLGNPPYVRHHQIAPERKAWLLDTARRRGLKASGLAGLHVHFFLATAEHGRPGDYGAFITSAEWLDVNYGGLVRQLLLDGLGGESLHVLDATVAPFADATTTGAITCFTLGSKPESITVRRVADVSDLGRLDRGRAVSRERLAETHRWSVLTRVTPKLPSGYIELGELCRVHRGAVTGANKIWVHSDGGVDLPERVLFASVTKARELFGAGERLSSTRSLRRVIDLPVDLDVFDAAERKQVERFLRAAKKTEGPGGLHRLHQEGLVECRAARRRARPGHLHGTPTPRIRPQRRPGTAHQHRARALSAAGSRRHDARQSRGVLALRGLPGAGAGLCGRAHQVRAEGDGAPAHPESGDLEQRRFRCRRFRRRGGLRSAQRGRRRSGSSLPGQPDAGAP